MLFSSLIFVCVFLPATVAIYFAVPKVLRNGVLVIASLIFYAWAEPAAVFVVVGIVFLNFFVGRALAAAPGQRPLLVIAIVAFDLLVLIIYKYTNFLLSNVNAVFAAIQSPIYTSSVNIVMPIGISFFTFHLISFNIDVHRGTTSQRITITEFFLYVLNFSQLIAGPIIRYHEIADQLPSRAVSISDVEAGLARFCAGLFKKVMIADPIGAVADMALGVPATEISTSVAWLGIICYTLQIYYDFSGYSDMAIGMARMFGFRFPENFNYPYSATSMQDFWRRWHMSLSRWFRDYVYIPLGGSHKGEFRTILNLWIVFLLVGAWHGASWTFVVWGGWHGLFLSIERARFVQHWLERAPLLLRRAYILLVVMLGWVLFRSESFGQASTYGLRLFGIGEIKGLTLPADVFASPQMSALIAIAVAFSFPIWPYLRNRFLEGAQTLWAAAKLACVVVALVLCLSTMTVQQQNPFIYFRF
jgi:alginate O-acetyltransferase complex protein AlgI